MINRFFGLIVLLSVMSVSAATGQVILPPGSQATLTANAAHGGSATTNNNAVFVLQSDYDLNDKTLKAKATVGNSTIGTGIARSQLFYDFEVPATPGTEGNTVGAWVSYVVDWRGFQAIAGVGSTNSDVEINIVLRDLTESRNMRVEAVHSLDLATQKVKYVTLGLTLNDQSLKADTFSAVLNRDTPTGSR